MKVFISHSYNDAEAREKLLAQLPRGVEPFVFPPITVPPKQMVSDKLLDAIRAREGLIYLEGGASAESFWVALERDYALRAGKRVFAFSPSTQVLRPDNSAPLELPIYPAYVEEDRLRVFHVLDVMRVTRYFDLVDAKTGLQSGGGGSPAYMEYDITPRLNAGGYVVIFWSKAAAAVGYDRIAWPWAVGRWWGRNLVALLESTEVPISFIGDDQVQLFGDAERSETQRIDDLIVRLYWLIYRNTRQNQLS